jgi:hypothetical protein
MNCTRSAIHRDTEWFARLRQVRRATRSLAVGAVEARNKQDVGASTPADQLQGVADQRITHQAARALTN